jgi:hypothetical protein
LNNLSAINMDVIVIAKGISSVYHLPARRTPPWWVRELSC